MSVGKGSTTESAFDCRRCGNCCRVPGYVRLRAGEVEAAARHLGLSVDAFTRDFTRLTADRRGLSLTEKENGECVFLTAEGACGIQPVKPAQCRDFPHRWHFDGYESVCRGAQEKAKS